MVVIGSIITVAFMGSVIVTPLYSLYQQKFGFSEIVLTLVYAVYVVGNVAALLLFGQISDQIGRKPVALPGLAVAGASALAFLFAQGTASLFAGRLLIGLAVGILSGTGTAWLAERYGPEHTVDRDRERRDGEPDRDRRRAAARRSAGRVRAGSAATSVPPLPRAARGRRSRGLSRARPRDRGASTS